MSSPPKLSKQTWEQLRDWLVPEELEPEEPVGYGIGADCGEFTDQWARWQDRQHLRDLLTAEADRAEKGEVEP